MDKMAVMEVQNERNHPNGRIRVEIDPTRGTVRVSGATQVCAEFDMRETRVEDPYVVGPDIFQVVSEKNISDILEVSVRRDSQKPWWSNFSSPMIRIFRDVIGTWGRPKTNVKYSVAGRQNVHVEEVDETYPHRTLPDPGDQPLLPIPPASQNATTH